MRFRDLDATTGADRLSAVYSPCCRWHAAAELGFAAFERRAAMQDRVDEALPYFRLVLLPMSERFWYSGGFHAVS
jgi:hypothetical protein